MNSRPIGIFDSGAGGLSIWKEINALLPHESTLYISDAKYAPYGSLEADAILKRAFVNTEALLGKGAKIIVVACNTATTNAISHLREHYEIPFIGIEPAIKPAALSSITNSIGILATKGTLSSALFHETSKQYSRNKRVIEQEGNGIVELIESGQLYSNEMKKLLEKYLTPMLDNNIDCLVLGCTHYHFLTPILKEILPENVTIIDSGRAIARQTKIVLDKYMLVNENKTKAAHVFYTNGSKEVMANLMGWDPSVIQNLY